MSARSPSAFAAAHFTVAASFASAALKILTHSADGLAPFTTHNNPQHVIASFRTARDWS